MTLDAGFHRLYFAAVSIFVSRYELASPTLSLATTLRILKIMAILSIIQQGKGVFVHPKHPRYATAIPMPSLTLITELH